MEDLTSIRIDCEADVGHARRTAVAMSSALGLPERKIHEAALVVTELATNLLRHQALRGELLLTALHRGPYPGLQVVALDSGPGIADLAQAVEDGSSGDGGAGTGLGAVRRLADEFMIHSSRPPAGATGATGTVVLARIWGLPPDVPFLETEDFHFGIVSTPREGETVSGDGFFVAHRGERVLCAVVDALGHGPGAHEVRNQALAVLESTEGGLGELVGTVHETLRTTRGAVLGIAEVIRAEGRLRYCGVGNINSRLFSPTRSRHLLSRPGIVGVEPLHRQVWEAPWTQDSVLVMHSDGLSPRWKLSDYPLLAARHPQVIACVLYRDFRKPADDATVMVLKEARSA